MGHSRLPWHSLNLTPKASIVIRIEIKPLVGRLNTMKDVVLNQAREELGLIEGLRTAFESMKKTFQKSQPPPPATRNTEDEDSMFIG